MITIIKSNFFKFIIISILLLINIVNGYSKKDFYFYTIKPDDRDCPYPQCGGYWLTRVNTGMSAIYVATISLDPSILNFNMSLITLAITDDLLLGGLILSYPKFQYFQVWNATRLIYTNGADHMYGPQLSQQRTYQYLTINDINNNNNNNNGNGNGNSNDNGSLLDKVNGNNGNNGNSYYPFIGESINLNYSFRLFNYTEMYSKSIPLIDVGWLHNVITNTKTINFGFMDETGKNFKITKIYLNIPLIGSNNCLPLKDNCTNNNNNNNSYDSYDSYEFNNNDNNDQQQYTIPTYHRDKSRCLYFSGCVSNTTDTKQICNSQKIPNCPKGYVLTEMSERPYGCKRYYCDVSFIAEQNVLFN